MALFGLLRRRRYERAGFGLYANAVGAARDPFLFAELGVPDTLDGRFDMIGLYAFLLIRRLQRIRPHGKGLAQAVFDAMFSDMDLNLREIGVGDLSVGKKVRAMWEAFHGRARAYDAALNAAPAFGQPDPLIAPLRRNIWRGGGEAPPGCGVERLALAARRQDAHLASQTDSALIAGQVRFLSAEAATR